MLLYHGKILVGTYSPPQHHAYYVLYLCALRMFPTLISHFSVRSTRTVSHDIQIEAPLSGYQYPSIHVASADDPASIYTSGSLECPALDLSTNTYYSSSAFHTLANSAAMLYTSIGSAFLQSILPPIAWGYGNAYAIYDYLSYLAAHNTSIYSAFTEPSYGWREQGDEYSDLDRLRWLADTEMTAFLGNVSIPHPLGLTFETATQGSISTIAGATLAANVLEAFLWNTLSAGSQNKVNVLVGDFDAFVSFFALAGLANLNSNFDGLPAYGSAMAFELFSYTNSSSSSSDANTTFPDDGQLWVRFLFRNGTDDSTFTSTDTELGGLRSYPLFGRGPSETDTPYNTFVSLMQQVAIASPGDWCTMCAASSVFCAGWNQTETTSSGASGAKKRMSPVIAGVVGAVIAIPAAALLLLAIAIPCGLRVRRVKKDKPSHAGGELGGFKGGSKLGSDPDLTLSKGGAHVGAVVERKPSVGTEENKRDAEFRERLGSWEMKETDVERIRGFGRSSVESLDAGVQPVRPDERV